MHFSKLIQLHIKAIIFFSILNQVLSLAGISLSYIRFFSASQLIQDGILIGFIYLIYFGSLFICYIWIISFGYNRTKKYIVHSIEKNGIILFLKILKEVFLIFLFVYIAFFHIYPKQNNITFFNHLVQLHFDSPPIYSLPTDMPSFFFLPVEIIFAVFIKTIASPLGSISIVLSLIYVYALILTYLFKRIVVRDDKYQNKELLQERIDEIYDKFLNPSKLNRKYWEHWKLLEIKKQDNIGFNVKYKLSGWSFLVTILWLAIIFGFISIVSEFNQHSYQFLYENNINFINIQNKIIEEYNLNKKPRLLYFNSDYMFFSIEFSNKFPGITSNDVKSTELAYFTPYTPSILILKTSFLFDNNFILENNNK